MTPEQLNGLYANKNLIEVLGMTLVGLNLLKERFKEEEYRPFHMFIRKFDGLDHAIEYAKQYLR